MKKLLRKDWKILKLIKSVQIKDVYMKFISLKIMIESNSKVILRQKNMLLLLILSKLKLLEQSNLINLSWFVLILQLVRLQ